MKLHIGWEPIVECPFCNVTAATAFNNDASMPMAMVCGERPGGEPDIWVKCECLGLLNTGPRPNQ